MFQITRNPSHVKIKIETFCRYQSIGKFTFSNVVVKSKQHDPRIFSKDVELSLGNFLFKNLEKYPERKNDISFVDGVSNLSLTFQQQHNLAIQIASFLKRKYKVDRNSGIAIFSPNHKYYFALFTGISLTEAYSTPVNPLYTENDLLYQVEVSKSRIIFAHPFCLDKAIAVGKKTGATVISLEDTNNSNVISINTLLEAEDIKSINVDEFLNPKSFDPDSLAIVPFSSGTTGRSKGVMLSHRNLNVNILQCSSFEGKYLDRGSLICPLPFFHIYGITFGLLMTYFQGAKLVALPQFDLKRYLELIEQHKITRAMVVPPIILQLAKHPIVDNYDVSSLESLTSAAAPLGKDIQIAASRRLNVKIKQAWGMSEMAPFGTGTDDIDIINEFSGTGSSGKVLPGGEAKIVDPLTGADLPFHQEGELLYRGPNVMLGYLNNPEATRATIRPDGWMHTGDIAYFDKDGWLYITDRCKELIKYKGFQVAPAELEALIISIPEVKDVVVIPILDEEAGELPRAYVVKQDDAPESFNEKNIIDFVAANVAPHKKLRGGVKFAKTIPKTQSGKLLRRIQIQIDRGEIPPL